MKQRFKQFLAFCLSLAMCLTITLALFPKEAHAAYIFDSTDVTIKKDYAGIGDTLEAQLTKNKSQFPESILHYQWAYSSDTKTWYQITGATGKTFTTTSTYEGKYIHVFVRADNYSGSVISNNCYVSKNCISGTVTLPTYAYSGNSITATLSGKAASLSSSKLHYQWQKSKDHWDENGWIDVSGGGSSYSTPFELEDYTCYRVKVTADSYSGYIVSDYCFVYQSVPTAKNHIEIENGEALPHYPTSNNSTEYLNDYAPFHLSATINPDVVGVYFDHWEIVSGNVRIMDVTNDKTRAVMGTEDAKIRGVKMPRQGNTNVDLLFSDVPSNAWFRDSVQYVYNKGFMTGMKEGQFGPSVSISRAQFAVILWRMTGSVPQTYTKKFSDVSKGTWYTDAVLWANNYGIVTGYQNTGTFGPADSITREQMALMMYRFEKDFMLSTNIQKGSLSSFKDANKVSGFAKEAMEWAIYNGIITGKENGTKLDPQGKATRAECATIIMRFLENCNI